MTDPVPDIAERRVRRASVLLEAAWRHRLLTRPKLADLRARADAVMREEGAAAPPWREAFERLLESLEHEAALNPVGLTFATVQLGGLLRQRARAARLWRAHPEIAAVELAEPIVVLGQMRSGTTRLQRLFGCDPRLAHTRFYEVTEPVPGAFDLRLIKSWAQLALLDKLNPALSAVHPSGPRQVDEPFGLLAVSFYGAQFEAQWRVRGFARWWESQDRSWVYGEFKHLLQTLAWQRGSAGGQPFVLKAPQFMEDLTPLVTAFPDARLICLNRDPQQVVASTASLAWQQMRIQSDAADRSWIGAEWQRKTALREAIAAEVRAAHPEVPQIETSFAAMNADWRGEMRRLYAFLGLELPAWVEARMARYLADAEASGYRKHSYRAEDFGLGTHLPQPATN
ncbi:sulfotransferase family protein [Qipengyuania sediminis]|uniref:sulfotransferase family protein n=1 Tax=Qipengyuania sediminis TaxID=1532023 RepID=UPI00105A432E|nr:sulfotransferase [Qipengyuania sediminis]